MKISIVIPTYEMYGKGVEFLEFSFKKIDKQTFRNFEVIVSDHSKDDKIFELCKNYSKLINVFYYKNENKIGNSSTNINNAIKKAEGDIVKVLFQDDFLFSNNSLMEIIESFEANKDKDWLISTSEHTKDGETFIRNFTPTFDENRLLSGENTISSPSVISFKNENVIEFDENLIWLMDIDFYVRIGKKCGLPIFLEKTNVVNRIWEKQFNNTISQEIKMKEIEYMKTKFKQYK